MPNLAGVQILPSDKIQYCDPNGLDLAPGDSVIIQTPTGERQAIVAITPQQILHSDLPTDPPPPILRKVP